MNLHIGDRFFKSLDHTYQWRKAIFLVLESMAWKVMNDVTGSKAKRIADKELSTQGTDWSVYKHEIMYDLLMVKLK